MKIKLTATAKDWENYHAQNLIGQIVFHQDKWKVEVEIMELPNNYVYYDLKNESDFLPSEGLNVLGDICGHKSFEVKFIALEGISLEEDFDKAC